MFCNSRGFSLIELAIILMIFGGLAAASTMLGRKWVEGTEVRTTKTLMTTLEKAIDGYARLNQRLPCPAPEGVVSTHADFGKETSAADGLCTGTTLTSGEVVKGVVPYQTLGVGKSLAYDAWGNRITYYVDRRITKEDSMSREYPVHNSVIGDIVVEDMSGGTRTQKAVVAFVSHGARAHGALNRQGTVQTVSNPNAKELENADVDAAGASTGTDKVLVQGLPGKGADNNEFDDIVSYKLRRQIADSQVNAVQNCAGQTVNWSEGAYSCTGSVADMIDGDVVLVSDTTMQDMGSVTISCESGQLMQSNIDCEHTPIDCSPATAVWTVDSNCSASIGSTITHGATTPVTNSLGGRTGNAVMLCNDGTFGVQPGAVCGLNCSGSTRNWTGASSCTQSHGALNHQAFTTISDTTAPGVGNVTVTCTNGAISESGASCNLAQCGTSGVSWGACTATVAGPQNSGFSTGVANATPNYVGSATATCTDGAWGLSGTSCLAPCASQNVPWSGAVVGCNATSSLLTHGAGQTLNDGASPTRGSVNISCNNGVLNQSANVCVGDCTGTPWGTLLHTQSVTGYAAASVPCGSSCASQTRSCSNHVLSGSYGATSCSVAACASCSLPWGGSIAHGASVTAWNTSGSCGGCASQTRTCSNGSLSGSYGFASCNNASCSSCPSTSVTGGNMPSPCCHTVSASGHGTVISVGSWDNAGGACGGGNYGSNGGTITCTNGTWVVTPGSSCWFAGGDGACFTKGTRVTMADGSTKPIEAVKIGDEVKGRSGINRVVGLKPTRAGDRAIYTINGTLKTTADHPALTDKGWAVISRELYAERYYGREMPVVVDAAGTMQGRKVEGIAPSQIHEYAVGDRIAFGESGYTTVVSITHESVAADTPLFSLELDGDGTMQLEDGYIYSGLGIRAVK